MSVKAVEMVRKIRDQIYEETKDLTNAEQIEYFRKGSEELQEQLKQMGWVPKHRKASKAVRSRKAKCTVAKTRNTKHHEQRSPR